MRDKLPGFDIITVIACFGLLAFIPCLTSVIAFVASTFYSLVYRGIIVLANLRQETLKYQSSKLMSESRSRQLQDEMYKLREEIATVSKASQLRNM